MFTNAPRIRPLRLALTTALIAGTLSGSAMAADGDLADLTCRKAGGTPQDLTVRKAGSDQQEYLTATPVGGQQSIIAVL